MTPEHFGRLLEAIPAWLAGKGWKTGYEILFSVREVLDQPPSAKGNNYHLTKALETLMEQGRIERMEGMDVYRTKEASVKKCRICGREYPDIMAGADDHTPLEKLGHHFTLEPPVQEAAIIKDDPIRTGEQRLTKRVKDLEQALNEYETSDVEAPPYTEIAKLVNTPEQERIARASMDILALLLKKNADYGSSAWKAPVLAPSLPAGTAILVRMSDKIERIRQALSGHSLMTEETLTDTMRDLVGYAILWLARPIDAKETE